MSARDTILGKLRGRLSDPASEAARKALVSERLANAPRGIIPSRGQLPDAERVALFETMATKAAASVVRLPSIDGLAAEIARYLKSKNLPASIRMGDDARLSGGGWAGERTLEVKRGASDGHDLAAVSHAVAAVAESGSLVLESGPDNPTTLNFLPEHHIVVVQAKDVDGDLESALERLRARHGKGEMPRVANVVTGPSRSGDIEQTIILGAHGPRALHIVIVA